ncbi:rho GTPase-activating protein 17-like isoform X4 [Polypterus senegalus]|uniref:rho GTPase-activating protein 17-like isoform X4 n=1 Tax=Polypterus senegalus TaxID=55291 RepID=UPI0019623C50|nr:rho GTPase-activating protein 17-like isoform X4 [Polypterus senegalus]
MKKQFNRMRQLANQTVGRAEKTEVLSEDLLVIEKRLETIRVVCHNTQKRLAACLQGQIGTDADRRHKKLPLTSLSQCMQEGGIQLGEESLLGKVMETCSEVESRLAMDLSAHEVQLEREVLEPLNQLAEVEIPNIQKQRKQLAKLVLDWDSARTRWNQAARSIISGANYLAQTAKVDSLKEEVDEASNKVELCKDQLAADMYNVCSKEGDYARHFVMFLEAQADYHRKSLAELENLLPVVRAQQESWTERPAFGTALEDHLKRSNREIALPIEACVMMLLETGMKEEGLFRIAAGASKLKKLKAALDCSTSQLEEFYSDPHAVAGALKSYIRELPEPLMTFQLYDEWIQASSITDHDKKMQALWVTCDKLPKANKANFRYLIKFLSKLAKDSDINKMTPSNIAIVLGPNLLWAKNEGSLAELAASTSVHVVSIIECFVQHSDWFFPEDIDFNISGVFAPAVPAVPSNHTNHVPPPSNEVEPNPAEKKRPVSMALSEGKESSVKPKETAGTPPLVRNSVSGLPTGNQLTTGPSPSNLGPSPHMMRRATKKPAPAPPKPAQLGPQAPPPTANHKPSSSHGSGHSPPNLPLTQPRRHSSNQPPIQAPSHPPPQPPGQTPGGAGEMGTDPSPPQTPTPPGTPPLANPAGIISFPPGFGGDSPSPSGAQARMRPVPKPRNRPSVPPPPQPPFPGNDNSSAGTGSRLVTDLHATVPAPPVAFLTSLDAERDTESTVL